MSGDDLQRMLEGTMGNKILCRKCGKEFTFEEGAQHAMKNGITAKVVICPKCNSVYDVNVAPRGATLLDEVTHKYAQVKNQPAMATSNKSSVPQLIFAIGISVITIGSCIADLIYDIKIANISLISWMFFIWFILACGLLLRQKLSTTKAKSKVHFDANGKVLSIEIPQRQWILKQKGANKYYTQKANSLLQAAEFLKKMESVPQLTYYMVDTPKGSLGRDMQGYYTESPLKTENLIVEFRQDESEAVEFLSLKGFGDVFANQNSVAFLKKNGEYSQLVLFMKCGYCGYESPVETQPGSLIRECYCCGVKNNGRRGSVNVFLDSSMVEI